MSGLVIEPVTSIDSISRNFSRLNEAIVALQGGSLAIENIEGYENLATKKDLTDEIKKVQYHIGDIHISEKDTDPKEKLGYGEWELISEGKVIVGVDSGDSDFASSGKTGGEKNHKLTVSEMPSHSHGITVPSRIQEDAGSHTTSIWDGRKGGSTSSAGGGESHNNLQPYYCAYIWKRIS